MKSTFWGRVAVRVAVTGFKENLRLGFCLAGCDNATTNAPKTRTSRTLIMKPTFWGWVAVKVAATGFKENFRLGFCLGGCAGGCDTAAAIAPQTWKSQKHIMKSTFGGRVAATG